jgi:formate/nitrite transporter FocA (FNT family)
MSIAPGPADIFERAVEEGERRLEQSTLELVSTSFIAGFTIVFGMVALGLVEAAVAPHFHELAKVAGALAFGVGVVFLVVGRAELFNENFYDPVAKAVQSDSWMVGPLVRLWTFTLVFNLIGGGLFGLVFTVGGALPADATATLAETSHGIVDRSLPAMFADAIIGGALVTMLSFLLSAVDSVGSRIPISYAVGVLLALGPFDHVVVTVLHVYLGVFFGAPFGVKALTTVLVVSTAGNMVGGLGLVTITHVAQAWGARESGE